MSGPTPQCKEAMRAAYGAQVIAKLNPDDGWISWQSSPHVMWLASRLTGATR